MRLQLDSWLKQCCREVSENYALILICQKTRMRKHLAQQQIECSADLLWIRMCCEKGTYSGGQPIQLDRRGVRCT